MRTVGIGFVIVLLVLSCGLAIRYNQTAGSAMDQLNEERYKRLTTEENLENAKKDVNALKGQLKRAEEKAVQTENVLEKMKQMNDDLRARLDRVNEIKVNLDKRIEELQRLVSPI